MYSCSHFFSFHPIPQDGTQGLPGPCRASKCSSVARERGQLTLFFNPNPAKARRTHLTALHRVMAVGSALLPLAPSASPAQQVANLSQIKNSLIGKRERKLEVLRGGYVARCAGATCGDHDGEELTAAGQAASQSSSVRHRRARRPTISRYRRQRSLEPCLYVSPAS